MKKLLLILLLIPLFAMGQKEHIVKEYCKVSIRRAGLVYIQTGDGLKELKDSIGNQFKVEHDCIELMNHMSYQGWELVPLKIESSFETFLFCRPKKHREGEK